jgi:AraC-like DNA-binding protein
MKRDSASEPSVSGRPVGLHDRAEMRAVLERAMQQAERRSLRVRVPREEGLMEKHKDMHFHFQPEVFLQLSGHTDFHLPKESLRLRPDEIAIMPGQLPHGETVGRGEDARPFRNLVVGFYSHTLSLHFAREVEPGRPDIEVIEFFDAPNLPVFLTLTNSLVHTFHMQTSARDHVLKGLLLSLLGMLVNIVDTGGGTLNADLGKVFQVKWLVREQFSNPDLSVKTIAERLHCTPDYLSHLFHRETGEKLIPYIQRVRIEGAILALETTPLYVSEIAYASGFSDPAYFARVFKKLKGETPQEFRARLDHRHSVVEARPKTIYFDREDYSPGAAAGDAGQTVNG